MFDDDTTRTQYQNDYQEADHEDFKESSAGAKIYFCDDCQTMLRPRDKDGKLEYFCPQCHNTKDIDDFRVYVNVLKRGAAGVSGKRSLSEDPTLPRKKSYCKHCGNMMEHVIFTAHKINGEETMNQMKECVVCHTQSEMTYDNDNE